MKLLVTVLCCLAIGQAADVKLTSGSTQQQSEETNTEKRALTEGNAGVQKRAPISVSPTPGIEYADSKQLQAADKSPSQQIYATPVPQLAKISDVLSGHGVAFPTAIASHLFSPISVYQPRLGSPTTYEVSQPIPSQLAYSEHKVYQPAQLNSVQYHGQGQQQAKPGQLARLVYNAPQPQLLFQPQQILYSQQQAQAQAQPQVFAQQLGQPAPQQLYTQQQTQAPQPQQIFQYQFPAPAVYNQLQQQQPLQALPYASSQGPVTFTQSQVQQTSEQPQIIQLLPQPFQYARLQQAPLNYQQQPQSHQNYPLPQAPQNYQQQPQQPQNYQQSQQLPLNIQLQQQHYQAQQHQAQVQRELKTVQSPAKVLEKQTLGPQQNYNNKQGAVSYASFSQSQPAPNSIPQPNFIQYQPKDSKPQQQQQQLLYVKNQAAPQNYQQIPVPQYQQQVYSQGQGILVQNPGFQAYVQQPLPAAPTFAPVQYFGKFAQSIFGYPQQQQ